MHTTLMSSKGQVIIPKALRSRHQWLAGTRLVAEETAEGVLLRPLHATAKLPPAEGLAALHALAKVRRPRSLAEMDAAIAREARKSSARKSPARKSSARKTATRSHSPR